MAGVCSGATDRAARRGGRSYCAVGPVREQDLERGNFGFIQTVGTGYDNVDLAAATKLGVWVANIPASRTGNADVSGRARAILLMLALSRQLGAVEANLLNQRWAQPLGLALYRKRACLIGLGDVGSALAERLHALWNADCRDCRRDAARRRYAPYVRVLPAEELREAVSAADYVIVCARPGEKNEPVLDKAMLAALKPKAIVINIARGSLVDHDALLDGLRSGRLGGAGLDVFWEEPADPAQPLFALPNVIATPHIAGVTGCVNMTQTLRLMAENLNRYARGDKFPSSSLTIRHSKGTIRCQQA